jgi:predicted DNA-binding helix-hairpin-helix protein
VCGQADAQPVSGPIRRLFGLPIDVNRVDADTLASLPGIGPSRAQAIIEGRPYAELNDLRRVPGIGAKRLAGIRHLISTESRLREEPIASHGTTWR